MGLISLTTAAALGLASLTSIDAETPKSHLLTQSSPMPLLAQGIAAQQGLRGGGIMTTPNGCTYRRTQAPGYPPRWILIVNPGNFGGTPNSGKCKGMM